MMRCQRLGKNLGKLLELLPPGPAVELITLTMELSKELQDLILDLVTEESKE